jgi:NDP-sugar pyrophosphorylase family protein
LDVSAKGIRDEMINVVIPMAGLGQRFVAAGYDRPKPFIEVEGRTLVELVLENMAMPRARYILVARAEHLQSHPAVFERLAATRDVVIVTLSRVTEGAACTVLEAAAHLESDCPLLIANSDQYVEMAIADLVEDARARSLDGSILTFVEPGRDPKWSYAAIGPDGLVTRVAEKIAISEHATVGVYYFAHGKAFVAAARRMVAADQRVNGEFYVCPVYNQLLAAGARIGIYDVPTERMHGLGTPEDLERFRSRLPWR